MMMKSSICKVAVAVLAICALFVTSCEKPVKDSVLEISLVSTSVPATSGAQFVTVRCSGSWTIGLTGDSNGMDWASLSMASGQGNADVVLTYKENTTGKDRTLSVVLDNGSKWVSCSMTQAAAAQEPQPDPEPEPEPTPTPEVSNTDWLELPAMDNHDLGYYSHSFEMNGSTYRNYTFGWSQNDLVA